MAWIETYVYSEVLGMEVPVHVILPQEKQPFRKNIKHKVLWLLHGGSGDETAWHRMSTIERYAIQYGLAVIMPGGMNSCFTDMEHGGKFFTYMTEELPTIIQQLFPRLSSERKDHFISGFSNGGYGCLRIGLARPDLYSAIGAMSAGDKADVPFVNDGSKKAQGRIEIFGDGDIKNTHHDLKYLAVQAAKSGQELPRIYHSCGSLDPWLDLNETLRDFFYGLQHTFDYTYQSAEGYGHTWDFWDMEIIRFLKYLDLEQDETKYIGM
jgi:putative tributyrin esterase